MTELQQHLLVWCTLDPGGSIWTIWREEHGLNTVLFAYVGDATLQITNYADMLEDFTLTQTAPKLTSCVEILESAMCHLDLRHSYKMSMPLGGSSPVVQSSLTDPTGLGYWELGGCRASVHFEQSPDEIAAAAGIRLIGAGEPTPEMLAIQCPLPEVVSNLDLKRLSCPTMKVHLVGPEAEDARKCRPMNTLFAELLRKSPSANHIVFPGPGDH